MPTIEDLRQMATTEVDISSANALGIFTSNRDCGDNDGCDGDCGGDGSEGC